MDNNRHTKYSARDSHGNAADRREGVLVAGGFSDGGPLSSAELYDTDSGTWTPTNSMTVGRADHTTVLLASGRVLVAGGQDTNSNPLSSAELFDPATGIWTATGSMNTARYWHRAVLLPNGKVMVMGGFAGGTTTYRSNAELYDPATGMWTNTGSLNTARFNSTTLLPNGNMDNDGYHAGGACES